MSVTQKDKAAVSKPVNFMVGIKEEVLFGH
jgi:hypothetical protein